MVFQNLRYAVRSLAKRPMFTLVAVSSLALGIGLNTTIFTAVNAVLFKRLPISEPERLVEIYSSAVKEMPYLTTSYPDYVDLRDQVDAFDELAAHAMVRGILYREGRGELVLGEVATDNYFETLGVVPELGRDFFTYEDETEGLYPVVVVSHGFWQRRLGGDPNVLGETVRLNGVDFEVVGVAPPEFTGTIPGLTPEFWAPTAMVEHLRFSGIQTETKSPTGNTRRERRGSRWLFVTGRLQPGISSDQAQAQVATVLHRLESEHPITNERLQGSVVPASSVRFHPMVDGVLGAASAVLLVAVALVLLIACANVANMLLARGQGRSREFAVRLSVGASRSQIVGQLMTESGVLAALAAVLGIGLAFGASRLLSAVQPPLPVPVSFAYDLDTAVLGYAILISLVTAVVFGLGPALRSSRLNLVPALKTDTGGGEERMGRGLSMSKILVVGQLALSLVLLVAGTLLTRGLIAAQRVDLGFDPSHVASVSFDLGMNNYSLEEAVVFQREVVDRLRALPGVEAVSLGRRFPLAPDVQMEGVLIPGHHQPGDDGTPIDATQVEPDYFRVFGVPLVRGRNFGPADREGTSPVVIINEAMADRYWPDQDPLGKRIYTDGFDEPPHEVIGVARNHKVRSIGEDPTPYLYFPLEQSPSVATSLFVRARGSASAILPDARREVLAMNPAIVFTDASTAGEVVDLTLMPTRVGAVLLGGFGLLALGLAAIGLYGVIAYTVSRRTREVGLRMALGARVADVIRMILGQGLRLAIWGIGIGSVASIWVGSFLRSLLYGVSAIDPFAFALAGLVLLVVAAVANVVPALRAAKVSPISALRYE